MSNNLRQIAKDLRSFVKRCKDVHYSDSLLISFLITGLLTIAPKLHADVASEQQEITAQTYDAITDLRQSFMRARKENEKSLKGAQSELVQLLKQGDQVIKSPWASFQFGTGYTNNDWGTTYRGRGGKYLEYYRRDNDLTKYVFDKDKHLYGATNLNIPRNQEPDALTINPANMHEPYKPYVPERMNNVGTIEGPTFNPTIYAPNTVDTTVTNSLRTLPAPMTHSVGAAGGRVLGRTSWGDNATFNYTNSTIRSYNGWSNNSRNTELSAFSTSNIGGTATSRATMENGYTQDNSSSYHTEFGTSYWWWNPTSSWTSQVQYNNLANPAPLSNGTAATYPLNNQYYTPGSVNEGYDMITSYGHSNYWGNYWYANNHSYWIYKYYENPAKHTVEIDNSGLTYDEIDNAKTTATSATVGTTTVGTVTHYLINGTDYSTTSAADAKQKYFESLLTAAGAITTPVNTYNLTASMETLVNNAAQNQATNWSSVYSAIHNGVGSGSGYSTNNGLFRESLILTNTTTNPQYMDVKIGRSNSGGSFLKTKEGANVTVTDVDVTLYNNNATHQGSAAYVIDTNGTGTNNITFATGGNTIKANANNVTAFNFQDDNTNTIDTGTAAISGDVWVDFAGDNNSVYRITNRMGTLSITNGNADTVAYKTPVNEGSGLGSIFVDGKDNVVLDFESYVDGGAIDLKDVQMNGSQNTMVYLQAGANGTGSDAGASKATIKVQGAVGNYSSSDKNVVIHASSGQSKYVTNDAYNAAASPGVQVNNVQITGLNVGFNKNANDGVMVYADNGTGVDVSNVGTNITDALTKDNTGAVSRDYKTIDYGNTSQRLIMGYATGLINKATVASHGILNNDAQSTINFNKEVDLVSENGTAYYVKDGGVITAKGTRAGGLQSTIAYADGSTSNGKEASITIEGDVIAADHVNMGDAVRYNDSVGHNPGDLTQRAYQNIGAWAINGADIKITGTTAATKVSENNLDDTGTAGNFSTDSLIRGLGAYVDGKSSSADLSKITVISGVGGALLAKNNGLITFDGNIVNQNNLSSGLIHNDRGTVQGYRYRIFGSGNDHTKVTPFYVERSTTGSTSYASTDLSAITFDATTNIDMYDGVLLTGNNYGNSYDNNYGYALRDYYKQATPQPGETDKFNAAKYRGMENVTAKILDNKSSNGGVNIGLVNQAKEEIKWDANQAGGAGTSGYLKGIGKDYTGMTITNEISGTPAYARGKNRDQYEIYTTIINSKLKVSQDVSIEDFNKTADTQYQASITGTNGFNDPFNNIAMESNKITVDGATFAGNASKRDLGSAGNPNYQVNGVGLSMGNSLYRWDNLDNVHPNWIKTKREDSGFYVDKGVFDIYGGTSSTPIAGLLVNLGTIKIGNGTDKSAVFVDHGIGIEGTDGSDLQLQKGSEIVVNGKSKAAGYSANATLLTAETAPSGENYGIVGVSRRHGSADKENQAYDNKVNISHKDATIYVEGDQATGIFAKNVDNALDSDVTITYENTKAGSTGIDVRNENVSSGNAKGIGIALVNESTNYSNKSANAGGIIELTGASDGALGTFASAGTAGKATVGTSGSTGTFTATTLSLGKNDIATGKNGIGIYAESANIKLNSDKFTIETKDDGVGLWAMDDTHIAPGTTGKKFQYNYNGETDKKGFAMAFGGKTGRTDATNYLDIEFNNKGTKITTLNDENTKSTSQGTYKGIAGILVNTNDALDTVTNYGKIKEEKSKTHVRTYGAVVNKGTFRNFGDITLNESLSENANNITSEDMKKANIGIFANDLNDKEGGKNTYIENYADIKIGDMTAGNSDKNIGSWAIYGYNIKTGKKSDGTQQTIDIARNNYGIYSGDGTVDIRGTKINVGNDTVLGHKMNTWTDSNGTVHNIDRQNGQYSQAQDLLSKLDNPRERDSAIGVYIDSNESRSGDNRNVRIDADMDIDRFSNGIVIAENNSLKNPITTVTIGDSNTSPNILLGSNKVTGGPVLSTKPTNPRVPDEIYEQGNSVYYYSADKNSNATSWANVKMNGDYNTAYYTEGSVENHGNIDLRSQNNLNLPSSNAASAYHGYGNVGIASANVDAPSVNYGTITTGMSDTENLQYSIGMGAGRNIYVDKTTATGKERVYDRTEKQGHVVNKGKIVVQEDDGIGMFATGSRSRAENWGTIELVGNNAIGMYLDRGAIGENHGTITGNANNLKGVLAINGGYIKNYGTIKVEGSGSNGIVTDDVKVKTDNTDGSGDLYGGTENSIKLATTGNPKTTGVGTTITMPSIVPITKISVDGVDTPIFNVETDAANIGDIANNITVKSSIQTGGTRIIDLKAIDEWGNPVWPQRDKPQLSEVTSVGMYVDTSGVRYTNPVDGLQNLPKLGEVNLYFGPEATLYTNAKAIRIGDTVDANGTVTKSNMLKPFNDALAKLPGGAIVNPLSASLTWQVAAKLDANNQLSEVYMSKVPYHSFAYDNDKSLVNFTNNLDNIYEIARPQSAEKVIFNKLNSLGNGEGHILAQAFDQMRGHIYGGVQQRIKSTSDILTGEMNGLRSDRNVSKDSNKFKAFGQRNEFKTDTAGMPDWYSNAGGFAFVHEDETVRLGQSSGWSAGVVNNYFTFKDLSKSYENQAMAKVGVFKTIPLDANGTFVLSLGGDGFFGRNDMKRRFWVVDQEFRAKASYYSYGAGLNAGLEKAFVINDGFSIVPNVGIRAEYGRFSSIHENGDMALNVKSDDYVSVKPSAGIDFRYSQEVFKNSNLTASLGFAYENEIGKLYDVENEARIVGAWTDYFGIRGDKEDKRGNFKSDLKLGLDNGRFGFNVNTGYDSKGHNFRAGLGLKVLY